MIILTIPIIFPVITQLGFDPIWFGVIIVMTVELGLDSSAGRHERFRHQERGAGRDVSRPSSPACFRSSYRSGPAGNLDLVSDSGALAAVAHDAVTRIRALRADKIHWGKNNGFETFRPHGADHRQFEGYRPCRSRNGSRARVSNVCMVARSGDQLEKEGGSDRQGDRRDRAHAWRPISPTPLRASASSGHFRMLIFW